MLVNCKSLRIWTNLKFEILIFEDFQVGPPPIEFENPHLRGFVDQNQIFLAICINTQGQHCEILIYTNPQWVFLVPLADSSPITRCALNDLSLLSSSGKINKTNCIYYDWFLLTLVDDFLIHASWWFLDSWLYGLANSICSFWLNWNDIGYLMDWQIRFFLFYLKWYWLQFLQLVKIMIRSTKLILSVDKINKTNFFYHYWFLLALVDDFSIHGFMDWQVRFFPCS